MEGKSLQGRYSEEEAQHSRNYTPCGPGIIQFLSEQFQQLYLDLEMKEQNSIDAYNTVPARVM